MDFRTFVRIILDRWKIVLAAIVACVVGAIAITAMQTKSYQSSATILMSFSGTATINEFFEATQTSQQRLSSYAEIAGGRTVAQRAIDELRVPMTADQLVKKTKVTYTPESLVFRLTVADSDPQRAAALAGAIASKFAALVPTVEPASGDGQQPTPAARATIVEQPVVADHASSPVPIRNVALGLVAGVLLSIALALVRNAADHTVRKRETLEKVTGLPTLAQLPRPGRHATMFLRGEARQTEAAFAEALRGFRTRLLGQAPDARSLLIAGAAIGQGVTTTALNLAKSLTEVDANVLLVEGDPRQASIAGLVGIKSSAGLADVLADRQVIDDAVHPTKHADLWALASTTASAPDRHLSTAGLPSTLEKLAAGFERVVIDGPPALVTAEAGLLAAAADATVLVVRAGHATLEEVEGALDNLRAAGGNVVGTVLTAAQVSRPIKAAARAYRRKVGTPA